MSDSSTEDHDQNDDSSAPTTEAGEQKPAPTIFAWLVRGISVTIILGLVGYFTYEAFQPLQKPVLTFTVQEEKVEQRGGSWALPIDVKNSGSMGVHTLKVFGTLTGASGQTKREVTIALLGAGETVTTTLWFESDPRGKGLKMAVDSYLLP